MPTRGITTFGLAYPPPSPPGDTLRGWGEWGWLRCSDAPGGHQGRGAAAKCVGERGPPPTPRATLKAHTTPHHPPSPLPYIDMHACLEVYLSHSKMTDQEPGRPQGCILEDSPVLQANSRTTAPSLCTCRGDAYDDGCTFRTLISFHSPRSLLL